MGHFICQCCEKELHHDDPRYIIEIKSFADFDGHFEGNTGNIDCEIVNLLKQIEDIDIQALENDVYKKISFMLCKECRDKFVRNPFQAYNNYQYTEEAKGTIH